MAAGRQAGSFQAFSSFRLLIDPCQGVYTRKYFDEVLKSIFETTSTCHLPKTCTLSVFRSTSISFEMLLKTMTPFIFCSNEFCNFVLTTKVMVELVLIPSFLMTSSLLD